MKLKEDLCDYIATHDSRPTPARVLDKIEHYMIQRWTLSAKNSPPRSGLNTLNVFKWRVHMDANDCFWPLLPVVATVLTVRSTPHSCRLIPSNLIHLAYLFSRKRQI